MCIVAVSSSSRSSVAWSSTSYHIGKSSPPAPVLPRAAGSFRPRRRCSTRCPRTDARAPPSSPADNIRHPPPARARRVCLRCQKAQSAPAARSARSDCRSSAPPRPDAHAPASPRSRAAGSGRTPAHPAASAASHPPAAAPYRRESSSTPSRRARPTGSLASRTELASTNTWHAPSRSPRSRRVTHTS